LVTSQTSFLSFSLATRITRTRNGGWLAFSALSVQYQNSPSWNCFTATISRPFNEGNGTYSVTAMLNPPSLGHVQAVVKVDGTNVNVAIVAHTPEGHRAIATHLDELRSELGAHGGDVQLSLSDGGNKGSRRDGSDPAPATAQESEEAEALVLTVAPAQGAKSLHVIL